MSIGTNGEWINTLLPRIERHVVGEGSIIWSYTLGYNIILVYSITSPYVYANVWNTIFEIAKIRNLRESFLFLGKKDFFPNKLNRIK